MNSHAAHPSRDELLAMAYADGELTDDARRELEDRLPREPALGRLVAQYRRLEIVARQAAPPEPMDHEWRRLERDAAQRAGQGLGWALLVIGGAGLIGFGGWGLWASDLPLAAKLLLGALLAGGILLLGTTLRARLRTLPYDPYTEVER